MNRRDAKKKVCLELGRFVFSSAETMVAASADDERIREASYEIAAEFLRRGGAEDEAAKVDERQLTIEEAIAEAES